MGLFDAIANFIGANHEQDIEVSVSRYSDDPDGDLERAAEAAAIARMNGHTPETIYPTQWGVQIQAKGESTRLDYEDDLFD